jgi:hypothetical protein
MAHRCRIDEPASTRDLRTAAVLRHTLEAGYTMVPTPPVSMPGSSGRSTKG